MTDLLRSDLLIGQANRLRYSSQTEKLVFMSYCDHADAEGRAWPSLSLVAAEAMVSPRTVQRTVKALRDRGLLVLLRDGRGRRRSAIYEVRPGADGPIPTYQELKERGRKIPESDEPEAVDNSDKTRHKGVAFSGKKTTSATENTTPDAEKTRHPDVVQNPHRTPISKNAGARGTAAVDNSDPASNSPTDLGWAGSGHRPERGRPPPARKPDTSNQPPPVDQLEERARRLGTEGKRREETHYQFWRRICDVETQYRVMSSTARDLDIDGRRPGESLGQFYDRVAKAHLARIQARTGLELETDPRRARQAVLSITGKGEKTSDEDAATG